MVKSLKAEKARKTRLKEGRLLQKQREKTVKAETKRTQVLEKKRKDIAKVRKKQGSAFKKATKAFGYRPKLSQALLGYSRAFDMPKQGAGRPSKVYKHTSPLSGKPVPAEVYYQHMRQFKNIQERKIEDAAERKIREYAKRGVPPSQIAQLQEQQRQQKLVTQFQRQQPQQFQGGQVYPSQVVRKEQIQNTEQLPVGTVVDGSTRIWHNRKGVVQEDWTAFGKRKIIRGLPFS